VLPRKARGQRIFLEPGQGLEKALVISGRTAPLPAIFGRGGARQFLKHAGKVLAGAKTRIEGDFGDGLAAAFEELLGLSDPEPVQQKQGTVSGEFLGEGFKPGALEPARRGHAVQGPRSGTIQAQVVHEPEHLPFSGRNIMVPVPLGMNGSDQLA